MINKIQHYINRRTSNLSRVVLQIISLTIVLAIGFKFYTFVTLLEKGVIPTFERPPGVEAFLPISALVSLKHLLFTGTINPIHPSGLILFLIICLTALLVKKGFCSWICPIGFLSDLFLKLHIKIFKRKIKLPPLLDLLLRSIKYLLAGFFIWSVFFQMSIPSIEQFIVSPYNQFADIKMLNFFIDISNTSLIVILLLSILSIIVPYFWCRYLCPYGALLGILSFLSIGKIKREPLNCSDCGICEKVCHGVIKIREKTAVNSSECSACMTCIQNCPEKNALRFSFLQGKKGVFPSAVALVLVFLFVVGISFARISDNWQNQITKSEYLRYIRQSSMPAVPGALKRQIPPEKMERMMQMMQQMRERQEQAKK